MASGNKKRRSALGIIFGILFFLFWRIDSWLCSVPMWLTLILHFTIGLSIIYDFIMNKHLNTCFSWVRSLSCFNAILKFR